MRNSIKTLNCLVLYFVWFPICNTFRIAFPTIFRKKLTISKSVWRHGFEIFLYISKSRFLSSMVPHDWLAVISYFGDISFFEVFSYAFRIKFRIISYFDLSPGFLMLFKALSSSIDKLCLHRRRRLPTVRGPLRIGSLKEETWLQSHRQLWYVWYIYENQFLRVVWKILQVFRTIS